MSQSYVCDDGELVDVGELSVDKLPQRLLLVSLRFTHRLKMRRERYSVRQTEREGGDQRRKRKEISKSGRGE